VRAAAAREIGDGVEPAGGRDAAIAFAFALVETGALAGIGASAVLTDGRLTGAPAVDNEGATDADAGIAARGGDCTRATPATDALAVVLPVDIEDPSAAVDVDSEFSHPSGATGSTNAAGTAVPARSKAGRFEYASAVAAMFAAPVSARLTGRLPVSGGRHTVGR
jgi:hypothetical protein